jgi:hypothetical protein
MPGWRIKLLDCGFHGGPTIDHHTCRPPLSQPRPTHHTTKLNRSPPRPSRQSISGMSSRAAR